MTYIFVVFFLIAFFFLWNKKSKKRAALPLSQIIPQQTKITARIILAKCGTYAFILSILFICLSLLPFMQIKEQQEENVFPKHSEGIFIAIDCSGSMKESTPYAPSYAHKYDWVKVIAKEIIQKAKSDAIGLVTFARTTHILAPLTQDKQRLLQDLQTIHPVANTSDDGTAIGYALFKIANLIVATKHYEGRNLLKQPPPFIMDGYTIIIITDGLQSPNPDDIHNPYRFMALEDAISFCQANHIRVCYIALDPVLKQQEFISETEKTEKLIASTGGVFLFADHLSTFEIPKNPQRTSPDQEIKRATEAIASYPIQRGFLACSMALFLFAVMIETIFARKGP